jgi:hypothetical protein
MMAKKLSWHIFSIMQRLNIEPSGTERNSFHFKSVRAKPPAHRGFSAYASESDIRRYSICNLQFSMLALPAWPGLD